MKTLYFFNFINLFRTTLLLDILVVKVYRGIVYFIDISSELFYSFIQIYFIRAYSNKYIIIINNSTIIFPLDYVYYIYNNVKYNYYSSKFRYFSRVFAVKKDYTNIAKSTK